VGKKGKRLEQLTLEEKQHLLKLLKQRKLKEKELTIEYFKPNAGAQSKFFKSKARIRLLIGGNGLGKTTCLVLELLFQHLRIHPHRDTTTTFHSWFIVTFFAL